MTRRQKAIAFFVALCVLLVAAAISLNIGWIIANAGRITPIVFGVILYIAKLIPLPAPWATAVQVVIGAIFLIVLLYALLGVAGHFPVALR